MLVGTRRFFVHIRRRIPIGVFSCQGQEVMPAKSSQFLPQRSGGSSQAETRMAAYFVTQ